MTAVVRILERVILRLGIISGFGVLLITAAIVLDVAGRGLVGAPLPGATELSELLLVALIFLGLGAAQQENRHYTVELVVSLLPPGLQRALKALALLVSLAVTGVLAWYSLRQGIAATRAGEVNYGSIPFPVWPARLILALGLWLLCAQMVIDLFKTVTRAPQPPASIPQQHD